jgi:hypothetical protein
MWVAIGSVIALSLFISFACGLSQDVSTDCPEPKVDTEVKVVYKDNPETAKERDLHIDMACQMAVSYEQAFEVLEEMAIILDSPIHDDWYENAFVATSYLDKYCIRY